MDLIISGRRIFRRIFQWRRIDLPGQYRAQAILHESQGQPLFTATVTNRKYKTSQSETRLKRGFRLKFTGNTFLVNAVVLLVGGFLYEVYTFHKYYHTSLAENPSIVGEDSSVYLYESDPLQYNIPIWKSFLLRLKMPTMIITYCRAPIWHYIQETNSEDPVIRAAAINTLAGLTDLEDIECYAVATSISFKTGVALANSAADPRLIPSPRENSLCRDNRTLAAKLREILTVLPSDNIHSSVFVEAVNAITSFDPTYDEYYEIQLDAANSFVSDIHAFTNPTRRVTEPKFLIPCLNAILSHSRLKEQIPAFNKLGILPMLHTISRKYRDNSEIMGIIIKIISNVSWHPDSAEYIEDAGLLRIIAELSLDDDIKLSLPARKALHNLDRDFNQDPLMPPGVYQLYPGFRFDDTKLDVDIIFVHGLMGGVFRTWRQQDDAFSDSVSEPGRHGIEDLKSRAYALRTRGNKTLIPLDLELEADIDSKNVLTERIKDIRQKIIITEQPKLNDKEYKPANRELRNGVMHYFQDHEKIELEPTSVPTEVTKCWPKDWLPKDIQGARVIGVDFESFVTRWNPVRPIESLSRSLVERSTEILDKLSSAGVGKRPIVWVAHSAGGLLVKDLLLQASASCNEHTRLLADNTEAIMFYSTPHFGAQLGSMSTAGKLCLLPTVEVNELNPDSDYLNKLNDQFRKHLNKHQYRIVSFGEKVELLNVVIGIPGKLVSLKSSDPGFGEYYALDLNHLDICKPASRGSFIYRKLVDIVNHARLTSERFRNQKECEDTKEQSNNPKKSDT